MSVYDPFKDTPNKIISEGQQISIEFEKISATSACICWSLPVNVENTNYPAAEYNGIVIVLDTVPIIEAQTPVNGKYYVADYTADRDLHLGDKIGTGLVVGAFYDDKTTKTITIQGVDSSTPYYVAGFAVDNVARYHTAGVRSYSLALELNKTGIDTSGYNIVKLGVQNTDLTGLNSITNYTLFTTIDDTKYTWDFIGSSISTYQDLIDAINFKIATIDNPYMGAIPQNANGLYVDLLNLKLYQWDGYQNNLLSAYFGDPSPNTVSIGGYWNDANNVLHQWDGTQWNIIPTFNYLRSLDQLQCNDYWFNGTLAYRWNDTIWIPQITYNQEADPVAVPILDCNTYWFDENTNTLNYWLSLIDCKNINKTGKWIPTTTMLSAVDPTQLVDGSYWFNSKYYQLNIRLANTWVILPRLNTDPLYVPVYIQTSEPLLPGPGSLWYNEVLSELKIFNADWTPVAIITWPADPTTNLVSGLLWWNTTTDILYIWDNIIHNWLEVSNFIVSHIDPSLPLNIATNSVWYKTSTAVLKYWDGMQWVIANYFYNATTPTLISGDYWYNTNTGVYFIYVGDVWVSIISQFSLTDPLLPLVGAYWYSLNTNTLSLWTGVVWMPVLFSANSLIPNTDTLWYNSITRVLSRWNGTNWVSGVIRAVAALDVNGDFILTSTSKGSVSIVYISPYTDIISQIIGLFGYTSPRGQYQLPIKGTDAIPVITMDKQVGVGTDGSEDERKNLVNQLLMSLGYPSIKVELSKDELNYAIDLALSTFRRNSGSAYERALFFMDFMPNQQVYYFTDKAVGLNRVTRIQTIQRKSSSFLGNQAGQGVYGQMVLQHLYAMGTYDLISYHIISEYVELLEILFASRVVFRFHERTRKLEIFQNIGQQERVLVDCTLERTEQELITDRISGKWIRDWALGEACQMLSQIRGKFSALPGAGGSVSLNASDLQARADALFLQCYSDIDDFIVNEPENTGLESTIVIG
jgi:hypothetical protein